MLFIQLCQDKGHTAVLSTTRAGKSRLLGSVIQAALTPHGPPDPHPNSSARPVAARAAAAGKEPR
jgi:hypothetical protein